MREIEQIAREVTDSANVVGELGKKGDEIGQIISVINGIADQTNLLAAPTPPSRRARKHERGFAVVADEVRKLAERHQATEQVGTSIKRSRQAPPPQSSAWTAGLHA